MKNLIRSIYYYPVLLILAFAVSSCGGGGGGDSTSAAPTTSQGQFIDSAVEGLTYTSGSATGLTDANGNFTYQTGQSVTFSIGDIVLGTVSGTAIVTPVQLVTGATNETDPSVVNIVQFLITIDDDHNPANGIQITPAIRTAAAGLSVDFTLGATAFDIDSNVSNVVGILTTASSLGNQVLVSNTEAQSHLKDSLFSIIAGTYSGTFSGTDSGSWTVTVSTSGNVSGSGNAILGGAFTIAGSISSSGAATATASGIAGTAIWNGTLDITTGVFTGYWAGGPENGNYTGSKN